MLQIRFLCVEFVRNHFVAVSSLPGNILVDLFLSLFLSVFDLLLILLLTKSLSASKFILKSFVHLLLVFLSICIHSNLKFKQGFFMRAKKSLLLFVA